MTDRHKEKPQPAELPQMPESPGRRNEPESPGRGNEPGVDAPELDNPNAGNPDAAPGNDRPDQRPITDNKAGG